MEELGNGSNPTMLCDIWRVYIIAFAQSLATSLELILASRSKLKEIYSLQLGWNSTQCMRYITAPRG